MAAQAGFWEFDPADLEAGKASVVGSSPSDPSAGQVSNTSMAASGFSVNSKANADMQTTKQPKLLCPKPLHHNTARYRPANAIQKVTVNT